MQLRHAFVISLKEGTEVLRQIFFIDFGERTHNAKIKRDVATKRSRCETHLDVAGVHVSMKKAVTKHLREKNRDAISGKFFHVHASIPQALCLAYGHAVHALHHHDIGHAIVPVHLGNHDQIQALHIAAQLRGVGRFSQQVQLVMQVFVELGHHLAGFEPLAIGRSALHPTGHHAHQRQVLVESLDHIGPEHLHGNFTPAR